MRPLAFVLFIAMSGCTVGPMAIDPEDVIAVGTAEDCTEFDLFVLVDKDRLQSRLPAGYYAADADRLLEAPQPTGQGAISFLVLDCEDHRSELTRSRHAQLSILIEPPRTQEEPVTYEFYELVRWTDDPESLPLTAAAGWNVTEGVATIAWNHTALGRQADGRLKTDQPVARMSFNASVGELRTLRTRYWQELPTGPAYSESRIHTTAWRSLAECDFLAGSPPAETTGVSRCGPGRSFAVLLPEFELEWRVKGLVGRAPRTS